METPAREDRTRIEMLTLADRAEVVGGKLYVMGGVIDHFFVPALPSEITFGVALSVLVPWHETNRPMQLHLGLRNLDGAEIAGLDWPLISGRPPILQPGDAQHLALAVPEMRVEIPEAGSYLISASLNAEEQAKYTFRVSHAPQPQVPQPPQ
jgi:hypothetical protein